MNQVDNNITCLVFCTSLQTHEDVEVISATVNSIQGIINWSVDLENWEKVLRIEGTNIDSKRIILALRSKRVFIRQMETYENLYEHL